MADFESREAASNRFLCKKLLSFQDTDAGNAEAFELLHGDRFRYDHTRRKWLVWNARYWTEDKDGESKRAALTTARARLSAASTISDREKRVDRIGWALGSESHWRQEAMLRCAQSLRSLAATTEQFDLNPFLLTVGNGTIDLKTGKLLSAQPHDLITRATDVPFDGGVMAPRWIQFLEEVFLKDVELIAFLQRAVGYSLTGDTREQCFFILYGSGANGKSTFVEIVCKLLGSHAETAEFSTFLDMRNSGSPRNDLARLHASRFVKAAEGERRARLAEAIIKELTGEDSVAARFLFKEHFTFKPQFKIWLITNHKPEIRGTDHAIWRRVRLIEFNRQFEGEERDPDLRRKLETELTGILGWAVRGCLDWQKNGLGTPSSVVQATQEYRQESDEVGRFIAARCRLETKTKTPANELYQAYLQWCAHENEKPGANNIFARQLAYRGISKKRSRKGLLYLGIGLAPLAVSATVSAASSNNRTK
jgi:putative DNA primase/helicase